MTQPGSHIELTTRMSKQWRYSLAFFIFAGAFAGSFFLNTRHNSFPYGFHPDEPSKADQILSGYRNFLHPQLMLEVAQHALNWSRAPRDIQGATELGREVSAVFAAGGVTAICIAGYLNGGLWGALLLGISCTLCSSLIVSAHYFKEDASLIMGLGLVLLATRCVMMARSRSGVTISVIFLGLACAGGFGKICRGGVFDSGFCSGDCCAARNRRERIVRSLWLLAAFACFAVAINYRGLIDLSHFKSGLKSEVKHSVTDHYGMTMNHPNSFFVEFLPVDAGWPIVILGAAAIPILLMTWRRRSGWDVLAILIGPGFLLVLSFSSLAAGRYLLPTVVMWHVMAGLAALWLIELREIRLGALPGGLFLRR